MDDRSETGDGSPASANLMGLAERLIERAPRLRTLLDDGVADHSVQLVLDVLADGYVSTSPQGLVLRANQPLARLIGRPLESLTGTRLEDLTAGASDRRTVTTLLAAPASTALAALQLTTASGEPVPVVVCVVPSHVEGERHWLVAADAGPSTGSSSAHDLSGEFLHDLRSALYVAWGFIELLLRRDTPMETDQRREMLEIVMRNLLKMQDLISVIRAARPPEPTEAPDTITRVDLAGLIGSVIARVDPGDNVQLAEDGAPTAQLSLDRHMVERSIEGLLEVVLRRPAQGSVTVSLEPADDGAVTVTLDHRSTERIEQGREHMPASAASNGGAQDGLLGPGLAILSDVARAHGGRAWAEGLDGGRARFHLELRAIPPAA